MTEGNTQSRTQSPPQSRNALWKAESGFLFGYTENPQTIRSIKRYRTDKGWQQFAEYSKGGKRIALQFKIPIRQRPQAEKVFNVKLVN